MERNGVHVMIDFNRPEDDFVLYTDASKLPVGANPVFLKDNYAGVCTGGSALFNIFSQKHRVTKDKLVIIFPNQLVSITEVSSDFSMIFFKTSSSVFYETLSGVCTLSIDFFEYASRNYTFLLKEREVKRFIYFCQVIEYRIENLENFFRRESIMVLLRVFYFDLYIRYKKDPNADKRPRNSSKRELVFKFMNLLMDNYTKHREVAFYAEKLFISPKHLTMVVKEITQKSAKEWIIDYTLLEIKVLLRNSTMDLKEIISRVGFPNQSLLSRFFREHTGMTPTQYRKSIYNNTID